MSIHGLTIDYGIHGLKISNWTPYNRFNKIRYGNQSLIYRQSILWETPRKLNQ